MADYFGHWLEIGRATDPDNLPSLFMVNWFRKDADGRWLWPGFGENSRVLKWVFERVTGEAEAVKTPIGLLPTVDSISIEGLDVTEGDLEQLLAVDLAGWRAEIPLIEEHYAQFGAHLPSELRAELDELEKRLAG
jgi:phosphoenolpyruvate carboxykinase (GTP)